MAVRPPGRLPKAWLTIVLLFSAVLSVSADSYSQSKRMSLSVTDLSLANLFEKIREQSDYSFFYNEENIEHLQTVSIDRTDATVEEILNEALDNTGLTYTMVDDVIIIKANEESVNAQQQPQKITIRGSVTDRKTGEYLPGVNVVVKNSVLGTVTDMNGEFEITLPELKEALVFSFIGFQEKEVPLDGKHHILNVQLDEEMHELGDVVVTGYQVINRRESTASIEVIKADDLDKIGSLTVDQMLEGKATGLMATQLSSTPGAASKIRIRSGGTFTGSRAPLWVVDGIIYDDPVDLTADDINSFDRVNLIGNALTGLNPQDIESINVLKDAAATAIWGTRAANGVIVVTTKRGKVGKATFTYSGSSSVLIAPSYSDFDLMNSRERIDVSRERHQRFIGYSEALVSYTGYEKALYDYRSGTIDYDGFKSEVARYETMNTDWFDELYRTGINQSHMINLSGGSEEVRYYYSVGYDNQKGIEPGVGLDRLTARANVNIDVGSKLKLAFSMSGSVQNQELNHPNIGNVFDEAYYNSRALPFKNEDGSLHYVETILARGTTGYQVIPNYYNFQNELNHSGNSVENKDFNLNVTLNYNLAKGVRLMATGSYRTTTNVQNSYIQDNTAYMAEFRGYFYPEDLDELFVKANGSVPFGGLYTTSNTGSNSYRGNVRLNLSKTIFDHHNFNVELGYELNSMQMKGSSGWIAPGYDHNQGRTFISIPEVYPQPGSAEIDENWPYSYMVTWLTKDRGPFDIYPSITDQLTNQMSMFGLFSYQYRGKYIIGASVRSDGSNQFGQYERYKFRPTWSVSGRWNIHRETFWGDNSFMDELALRASYGFRGTPPGALPYMLIEEYTYNATMDEDIAQVSSMPNANLTWEQTSTINAGLDFSLYQGRLNGSMEVAYNQGKDLIISRDISYVNGLQTQLINGGKKEDYAYELSLRGTPVKSQNWGLRFGANATWLQEVILEGNQISAYDLDVNDYLNGNIYESGHPIDGFYSYQFDGLDEQGFPKYKNLENTEGTANELLSEILTYSGRRSPQVYGGFNAEVRFKRFTANASFSYQLGHHIRLLDLYNENQSMPLPTENLHADFNDRWRQPGDEKWAVIPTLSNNPLSISESTNLSYVVAYSNLVPYLSTGWSLYDLSDIRVVRGDHIRLQAITLGYNVPEKSLAKLGLRNMRLSGSMSNLAVWAFDKRLKGQDPNQVQGVGMPMLPTYTFALNIGF